MKLLQLTVLPRWAEMCLVLSVITLLPHPNIGGKAAWFMAHATLVIAVAFIYGNGGRFTTLTWWQVAALGAITVCGAFVGFNIQLAFGPLL